MSAKSPATEKLYPGALFILSLAVAYFATATLDVMPSLLLSDIAATFEVTLGAASQIRTFTSIATFVAALLTGVLSTRFKHKSLLLTGVGLMILSSIGCIFVSTLSGLQFCYALNGIGSAIVLPIAIVLIGDFLPLEKRAKAVGFVAANSALSFLAATLVTGFLAGLGGWRLVPLLFALPISVTGLLFAFFVIPSTRPPYEPQVKFNNAAYLRSFKHVFLNKSAIACLIGNTFRSAAWIAPLYFGITFYMQRFSVSLTAGTGIIMAGTLIFVLGSVIAGKVANRIGLKTLTVIGCLVSGVGVISLFLMPTIGLALSFDFTGIFFAGIALSAATSLSLEQVPDSRGTMMALNTAVVSIGTALVAAVGGVLLDLFSFEALGPVLGSTGIIAAAAYFLAKDPSRGKLRVAKPLTADSAA